MFMKPMHRAMAVVGSLGLLASACNTPPVPIDEVVNAVHVETVQSTGSNQIDVLFVIANSTSVDEERVMLEAAFPRFIRGLLDLDADFHIGVITPDMQTHTERGALHLGPNAAPEPGTYPIILSGEDEPVSCTDNSECLFNGTSLPGMSGTVQGTCDQVEVDDGAGGTTTEGRCFFSPRFCSAPPAHLQRCNERFVPLMVGLGENAEQVSCQYNPPSQCTASHYPPWDLSCDDRNNAECNSAEGPAGERRCSAQGLCEVKPAFLRAQDYPDSSADGVDDDRVVEDFACLSAVGTCHISASTYPERGLDSVFEALRPGRTLNEGFIRPDALLLVVFVSDDDDCSVGIDVDGAPGRARLSNEQCWGEGQDPLLDIEEMYEFLTTQVKRAPEQVMTAAIVGPVPTGFVWSGHAYSCSQAGDDTGTRLATAGDRYTRLVRNFGHRGVVGSICEADFSPILDQVTRAVSRSLGQTCLSSPPKACTVGTDECGPNAECVQAAPPRVLLRGEVNVELGLDGADEETGEKACSELVDCIQMDADDEFRSCTAGRCAIGGREIECTTSDQCFPAGTDESQRQNYVCDSGLCYRGDLPSGTTPRYVCDDFQVIIESSETGSNWSRLKGPGDPASLVYDEDHDYQINYYATEACPTTSVGVRFVSDDLTGKDVRLSYPVSLRDQMFQ